MTIRSLVEANVGQVSDELFQEACEQTTNDIKANKLLIGMKGIDTEIIEAAKTTACLRSYIVPIMVAYIELINRQKEKAICDAA